MISSRTLYLSAWMVFDELAKKTFDLRYAHTKWFTSCLIGKLRGPWDIPVPWNNAAQKRYICITQWNRSMTLYSVSLKKNVVLFAGKLGSCGANVLRIIATYRLELMVITFLRTLWKKSRPNIPFAAIAHHTVKFMSVMMCFMK